MSTFPCPGQHAQQHLTLPGQVSRRMKLGCQTAVWERGTEAVDPWECDLGDRITLRYPAPEKLAGHSLAGVCCPCPIPLLSAWDWGSAESQCQEGENQCGKRGQHGQAQP